MNIILLTPIILTLALVHGGQGSDNKTSILAPKRSNPCQDKSTMKAYLDFRKRHILQHDLNSDEEWEQYLMKNELCGRAPVQSFIKKADEKNVLLICSNAGRHLRGNLCISKSAMTVHDVHSDESCNLVSVNTTSHHVIVACNKVGKKCLPVHYEGYNYEIPGNFACI